MANPTSQEAEALSAFSSHLQARAELEKSQLARKLHDELGGLLTAAKMDLSWLQSRLTDAIIQARLTQLGGVLDEAMDLKRRVVEELRPSLLDHFGLPTTLRTYVAATCGQAGLATEFAVAENCETSRDRAIAIFRIVQEGVSNIIRHARARRVRLELGCDERSCHVSISDDGVGFDSSAAQFRYGNGLLGVRQRVRALGGRMDLQSAVNGGTRLIIEVPVQPVPQ